MRRGMCRRLSTYFYVLIVSGCWDGPLIQHRDIYRSILENSVLPASWQQFDEGPYLFHQDNDAMQKEQCIKKCFSVWCERIHPHCHPALLG